MAPTCFLVPRWKVCVQTRVVRELGRWSPSVKRRHAARCIATSEITHQSTKNRRAEQLLTAVNGEILYTCGTYSDRATKKTGPDKAVFNPHSAAGNGSAACVHCAEMFHRAPGEKLTKLSHWHFTLCNIMSFPKPPNHQVYIANVNINRMWAWTDTGSSWNDFRSKIKEVTKTKPTRVIDPFYILFFYFVLVVTFKCFGSSNSFILGNSGFLLWTMILTEATQASSWTSHRSARSVLERFTTGPQWSNLSNALITVHWSRRNGFVSKTIMNTNWLSIEVGELP